MRTKLTPLGRVLVVIVLVAIGAVAGAAGATATKPHAQAWRCVLVRPGDTLWDLSRAIAPGRDRRPVIAQIVRRNALVGSGVSAGEAVWVPWDGRRDLPGVECGATANARPLVRSR